MKQTNKTMEKDDYAKMKARQEIVTAFMSKLEKVDIADRNLIPALYDYVVEGERTLFDEYNKFRDVNDTEKKVKDLEKRLEETHQKLDNVKEDYEKTTMLIEEYQSKIRRDIINYKQWIIDLRRATANDIIQKEGPNMSDLLRFAQEAMDMSQNGWQKKLWLKDGNKMRTITAILFDGTKAVLEASDDNTILMPIPNYETF